MPEIVPCPECKAPTYTEPDMSGGLRRRLAGPFSAIRTERERAEKAEARVRELEELLNEAADFIADYTYLPEAEDLLARLSKSEGASR